MGRSKTRLIDFFDVCGQEIEFSTKRTARSLHYRNEWGKVAKLGDCTTTKSREGRAPRSRGEAGVLQNAGATRGKRLRRSSGFFPNSQVLHCSLDVNSLS